jgi:hypothetical protein
MGLNVRGHRQSRSFHSRSFSSYVQRFTDAIRGLPLDPAFSIFVSGKPLFATPSVKSFVFLCWLVFRSVLVAFCPSLVFFFSGLIKA